MGCKMNRRILIADDEAINNVLLKKYLNNIGFYNIHTAKDGEEAYYEIRNNNIDLLITDYRMPKMNGVELIKKLRKEGKDDFPIFLCTAYDYEYVKEEEKLEDEYLQKPINFNILKILIERYV